MRFRAHGFALILTGLFSFAACGPAEEVEIPAADSNASVAITNLGAYEGMINTKEVMVAISLAHAVDRVELLCGDEAKVAGSASGQVTTLMWDTTQCPDGVVNVWLRVFDEFEHSYESEPLPVVLVNQGTFANLLQGNNGSVTIPTTYSGVEEVDTKHHWANPAGIKRIVVVLDWYVPQGQDIWDIELAIGCGICPHSGTTWGQPETAQEGPLVIDLLASDIGLTEFANDQAFVHVRPLDPYDHLGEALPYSTSVFLYQ